MILLTGAPCAECQGCSKRLCLTLWSALQGPAAALAGGKPAARKAVEVGEGDFFWELNANQPFPKVAADVDIQLTKYKEVRPSLYSAALAPSLLLAWGKYS